MREPDRLSNCVINLSPDKERVFSEAYRVLTPGGRVMISRIMLSGELPEPVRGSLAAYAGCTSGAVGKKEYLGLMEAAGFREVRVVEETAFAVAEGELEAYAKSIADAFGVPVDTLRQAAGAILSVRVSGVKPAQDQ